jgi:hypothetical protein
MEGRKSRVQDGVLGVLITSCVDCRCSLQVVPLGAVVGIVCSCGLAAAMLGFALGRKVEALRIHGSDLAGR